MPKYNILPELQGYVNIAKKKARDGDFWSALDILGTTFDDIGARKQKDKEAKQRAAEIEDSRKFAIEQTQSDRTYAEGQRLKGKSDDLLAEEKERQKKEQYQPDLDAFYQAYDVSGENDDPVMLKKAKRLLARIPEEYQPVRMGDIEQEIDNIGRRKNENTTTSAAMEKFQRDQQLAADAFEALKAQFDPKDHAILRATLSNPETAMPIYSAYLGSKYGPKEDAEGEGAPPDNPTTLGEANSAISNLGDSPVLDRVVPTEAGMRLLEADEDYGLPAESTMGKIKDMWTGKKTLPDSTNITGAMQPTTEPFAANFPRSQNDVARVQLAETLLSRFPNKYGPSNDLQGSKRLADDVDSALRAVGAKKKVTKEDAISRVFDMGEEPKQYKITEKNSGVAAEIMSLGYTPEQLSDPRMIEWMQTPDGGGLSLDEAQAVSTIVEGLWDDILTRYGNR